MRYQYFTFFVTCLLIGQFSLAQNLNCNEPMQPASATDSPSRQYFKNIVDKGSSATLDELMVLWYPDRHGNPQADNTNWDQVDSSKLDTFYSWGSANKLAHLQNSLPDDGEWSGKPLSGMLDTLVSAIGSWGYGIVPIRIKRKLIDPRHWATVINPKAETIFDDSVTIESWSFGTPEHYDEIVRDYLRYKSGLPWIGYWASVPMSPGTNSMSPQDAANTRNRLFGFILDGHLFDEASFTAAMLNMAKTILNDEGRIYYSRGVCRNRTLEFETQAPTYINPFPGFKYSN